MFVAKSVETEHKDLIHDVAYDHYGRRMATCSSDQSIKVWDIAEDGTSQQVAHWKAHSGSVWRVTWAHPEFGQVLGTSRYCVSLFARLFIVKGIFTNLGKKIILTIAGQLMSLTTDCPWATGFSLCKPRQ